MRTILIFVPLTIGLGASLPSADSQRGQEIFQKQGCVRCHSVQGKGVGTTASDLGRIVDRNFTPALLASTMWNHGPTMWSAMRQKGVDVPELSEQDAADLFAFFYSARYFDRPGDAARGKRAFAARRCADCHGISDAKIAAAPPVSRWQSLQNPVALAESMWNHSGPMREEMARQNIPWQRLSAQELADILVYLRNLKEMRGRPARFQTVRNESGEALFESKGCVSCHKGELDLKDRLRGRTLTDIAVAMWNHSPQMAGQAKTFEPGEMSQLLSYIWAEQYFEDRGNPQAGRKVFTGKSCTTCHSSSGGAPDLSGKMGQFSSVSMVASLWRHGPSMFEKTKQMGIPWPRLTEKQMSDLIAYLNSPR
ncbi:MAG TPA: cytochrome c [Bryobacteraceae bacterium]|nr:cytochrome c [Bryobacteraceae bacterium]